MKLYFLLVALSAACLVDVHGEIPESNNVKTNLSQLNWLDKILIRKFHPTLDLNKMAPVEAKSDDKNTVQGDYEGWMVLVHNELPLLLLQLVKLGDDILLPTLHHEFVWWYCVWDVCSGFTDIYDISNARLNTVTTTSLHASMNGPKFRVEFTIPDMEIECAECTLDHTDLPSNGSSINTFWRGYSLFVKNYTLIMTGDFGWNSNRVEVNDLDLTWEIDEFWDRQWNATHTASDSPQEEWGSQDDLMHEVLMKNWPSRKAEVEENTAFWLNCYLSNGRNNEEGCGKYFNESLHNTTAAEILHTLGLAALNNKRAVSNHQLPSEINLNAEDPLDVINSVLFEFVPHLMQTGRYVAALNESDVFPLQRAFTWELNKEICEDSSTERAACETFQEYITIGAPPSTEGEYTTTLSGSHKNRASLTFDVDTVSYSFHVADMTLSSTDYQRILTNVNTGDQQAYRGLTLNVSNCTVGFVADYAFNAENGHYAITMKKIELYLNRVTMDIPDVSTFENEEWMELPPIHKDAAPIIMTLWEGKDQEGISLEEKYRAYVEGIVNDFLAGRIVL